MGKQAIEGAPRGQVFYVDPASVLVIGRDTKHKAGEHPLYDERCKAPLDEALVRNILRYGNRVPVLVRKNGVDLEVVDGRGRTLACREAARRATEAGEAPPRLKVEVVRDDEPTAQGVMISLNEQRRADDVLIKARKAARLLACGHSSDEVAVMFGVTGQAVRIWAKVAALAPNLQSAIADGKIAASAALALADLPAKEQAEKLAKALAASGGKRPTVEVVRQRRGAAGRKPSGFRLTKRVARAWLADGSLAGSLGREALAILRLVAGDTSLAEDIPALRSRIAG
jgi:ParB-like chromosome segregation protein Spo0J